MRNLQGGGRWFEPSIAHSENRLGKRKILKQGGLSGCFRGPLVPPTAVSKNFDPRGIIRKHESLLGRPQTEDSRRRETRRLQARDRQPVRGEPLLGQTLHQDGARGRLAGPEEAPGQTS